MDGDDLNTKDEDIILIESSTKLPAYVEVEVKIRGLVYTVHTGPYSICGRAKCVPLPQNMKKLGEKGKKRGEIRKKWIKLAKV